MLCGGAITEYKLPKDYKKPDKFKQVEFDQFNHELYNSPITLVQSAIETQIEDGVLKTVQEIGFDIDPEQLYKALQYDRNQYDKGYSDAKRQYDRGHAHWIYNTDEFTPKMRCSVCGYNRPVKCICNGSVSTMVVEQEPANFCNNCGAIMDEEVEE